MSTKEKLTASFYLPAEMIERLKEYAEKEGRSVSNMLVQIIKSYKGKK